MTATQAFDLVIVGGGIVGMMTAREALKRDPSLKLLLLEKEGALGAHATGRNSGVLHTGIYYAHDSLKARFCADGNRALKAFAAEKGITVRPFGKVIVAQTERLADSLVKLHERGLANGVDVRLIDSHELAEIEPHARTAGKALFLPETASIDAKAVLREAANEVVALGGRIEYGERVARIDEALGEVRTGRNRYAFGKLINAAGAYADELAHQCGVGLDYTILPFKGIYHELLAPKDALVRGHIYPTPDDNMPFLGVHLSRNYADHVMIGPTAIPALGRENYGIAQGIRPAEGPGIFMRLAQTYWTNQNNLRDLIHVEVAKYSRSRYLKEVQLLCPEVAKGDLKYNVKVGIRAQLMNKRTRRLEMDFVVERTPRTLHVLNAISPAFTCSIPFARYTLSQFE